MRRRSLAIAALLLGSCAMADGITLPVYPVPDDNAFDDYLLAVQLMPAEKPWEPILEALESADVLEVEIVLGEAAPILEQLRIGLDKPCVMPGGVDFSTPFPYLAQFRSLVRLLMVESWVHSQRDDPAAAAQSCLDALKLGQDTARNGALIHKLVSLACEGMALKGLRALGAEAHADPDVLAALVVELADFETLEIPLAETLVVEWDGTRRSLEKWRADPQAVKALSEAGEDPPFQATPAMLDAAERELEAHYARTIAAATQDWWRREGEVPRPESRNPVTNLISLDGTRLRARELRHLAALRATRLVLALELHLVRHQAYPESLSALVPDCLAALPLDPFSGESFCYVRVDPLNYTLYSVGPNMQDDGGAPEEFEAREGDIAFAPDL